MTTVQNVSTIKLMIAEDHTMFRNQLVKTIRTLQNNIAIIGAVENGLELLSLLKTTAPDIILLDMRMPIMDGEETLKRLRIEYPQVKVIVFSSFSSSVHITKSVLNGASAHVSKDIVEVEDLIKIIEKVFHEGFYFNDVAAQQVIRALAQSKKIYFPVKNTKFSEREMEIITLLCQNKQVKEIAYFLKITEGTVKKHKEKIFIKTESDSTVALVLYAIRHGIFNADNLGGMD